MKPRNSRLSGHAWALGLACALLSFGQAAQAQHGADAVQAESEEPAAASGHAAASSHGAASGHGAASSHGAAEHGGGHDHVPTFEDINWFEGFFGESADAEPGLLFRRPGTPVPLGALLLNYGVLFFLLIRFARRPIAEGLKQRKTSLTQGIAEASKMKAEAQARLEEYEQKLAHLDDEVARVKREMREAGEAERARVLKEAQEKRERMERDARLLVQQEFKVAHDQLHRETVEGAILSARALLVSRVGGADQERSARDFLTLVDRSHLAETRASRGDAS